MFERILNFFRNKPKESYDFNRSNPLGGNGERVDFIYSNDLLLDKLDIYQINHYRRYEFAEKKIDNDDVCGDFACGTGYGSVMLSKRAAKVTGADIDNVVIDAVKSRYILNNKVEFFCLNLLDLAFVNEFDKIVSFETIEHFDEAEIKILFKKFANALKKGGMMIFSTPYMQVDDEGARSLGFHKTFYIDENKITGWLSTAGLKPVSFYYQNYKTHKVESTLNEKDFIICIAVKN